MLGKQILSTTNSRVRKLECALSLMNNGRHVVWKKYPQVFIEAGINQLWQPSPYAGTCGEYTTGLIHKWLSFTRVFIRFWGRKDLNNPPTSVGGISSSQRFIQSRNDLNDPPTPVGGI